MSLAECQHFPVVGVRTSGPRLLVSGSPPVCNAASSFFHLIVKDRASLGQNTSQGHSHPWGDDRNPVVETRPLPATHGCPQARRQASGRRVRVALGHRLGLSGWSRTSPGSASGSCGLPSGERGTRRSGAGLSSFLQAAAFLVIQKAFLLRCDRLKPRVRCCPRRAPPTPLLNSGISWVF